MSVGGTQATLDTASSTEPSGHDPWKDPNTLRELYHGQGLSLKEIGEKFGCSNVTIHNWMKKFGIDRRDGRRELNRDRLYTLYIVEEKTTWEIAEELDCAHTTVSRYLKEYDIPLRPSGRYSGQKSSGEIPMGEDWNEIRADVLERDGFRCRICGVSTETAQLDVHHIISRRFIYQHPFCSITEHANVMENLITLCSSHHGSVEQGAIELEEMVDLDPIPRLETEWAELETV